MEARFGPLQEQYKLLEKYDQPIKVTQIMAIKEGKLMPLCAGERASIVGIFAIGMGTVQASHPRNRSASERQEREIQG